MRLADDPSLVVPGIGTGAISLDLAVEDEVVAKSQAWFNYGEICLGQGRKNANRCLDPVRLE